MSYFLDLLMFSLVSSRISCSAWYISYFLIQVSTQHFANKFSQYTPKFRYVFRKRWKRPMCLLQLSLVGFPNPGMKVSECCCLCLLCSSAQNCCCYAAVKLFSFQGGGNLAKLDVVPLALINLWSVIFWSLGMYCRLCLQYRMMTFV